MFALILALTFNPATHQTGWIVTKHTFQTEAECVKFAESKDGQKFMFQNGALSYACDTLK